LTNDEIAQRLFVSDRAQLVVAAAYQTGLVCPGWLD
jgi:hypothetical protein